MITQTPISVRMSFDIKKQIDDFCYAAAAPRNMVINRAVKEYVELLEIFTRCACYGQDYRDDILFIEWCKKVNNRRRKWVTV